MREGRSRNLTELVVDFLAPRGILLILDNFEHLLSATPFLSALLANCPKLRLIVTSRARLHLYGEHEFIVSPLLLPAPDSGTDAADSPAVRLFCARAQAARADFRLTPALTPTVVDICRHLDGLPLAIELTAACVKMFSPQELQQRLERRLPLGAQGVGDLPSHLRVLENAIAWSVGLLSLAQQTLLARLAVFTGGFSLAAAQAICASPLLAHTLSSDSPEILAQPDIADDLNALLDQSLLVREVAMSARSSVVVMGGQERW
jgi:predicted ATPase